MVDDSVVAAICAGSNQSEDTVRAVLTVLENVLSGDPVGTVLQDPKTGSVAHRVSENGVPVWRVSSASGKEWRDTQPSLKGWKALTAK